MFKFFTILILALFLFSCSEDKKFLDEVISENLEFFEDGKGIAEKVNLPQDYIALKDNKKILDTNFVNSTEIGLYLNILTLIDKGIISSPKISSGFAKKRILETLEKVEKMETWNGLFFWPYNFVDGEIIAKGDRIAPAVDNGNFSISLATLVGAYQNSDNEIDKKIVSKTEKILDNQKEGYFQIYDGERKLLSAGWDVLNDRRLGYWIDRKMNESRLATIWAILLTDGKIPIDVFINMGLTTETYRLSNGRNIEYYLTWDGGIFQAFYPALFIDEKHLIKNYYKFENFVYAQKDYIDKNWIPSFISASSTPDNGYTGMGVMELAEVVLNFKDAGPYIDFGTPHATALTYMVNPKIALYYLKKIKKDFPKINSNGYGWYDAISYKKGNNSRILSLDQGMFILSFYADYNRKYLKDYLERKGKWDKLKEIYSHFKEEGE
ncbi:MAG: hypothetical protein KDK36_00860 [Leptospiraceae bacterium]|nr:hypothetical protein [Leptospiraceae bacterium]